MIQNNEDENYRNVIVEHRRYGKTTKLFNLCVSAIERGERVLFLSNTSQISRHSYMEFRRHYPSSIDNQSCMFIKYKQGSITFMDMSMYRGRNFIDNFQYKVADDIDWVYCAMDAVSLTGNVYKENEWK